MDVAQLESGKNVVYLTACALNKVCPEKETVKAMKLDEVFAQASRHSMQAITYIALAEYIKQNGTDGLDVEVLKKWNCSYSYAVKKLVLMSLERENLTGFLEKNGIWYMPLKGVIMLDYYPKLGMRQMSDNDILVDADGRAQIRDFMLENGYEIVHYGVEHPDTYYKNGKFLFEIHHALYFNTEDRKELYEYYSDVKERLVSDGTSEFGYRFSDEDFYIYIITHAHKHFTTCGNGIRSLSDTYVLMQKFGQKLRSEYVRGEIEKLGMTEYARNIERISEKLFAKECPLPSEYETLLDEQEMNVLLYHITSGVFGTSDRLVSNTIREMSRGNGVTAGSKIKYLFSRVFPDMDFYKINYPAAYKHRILLPVYWFYRILRGIFHFRKSTKELWAVIDARDEKI